MKARKATFGSSESRVQKVLNIRIQSIARVADSWLEPKSSWMRRAEREIPKHAPYSKEMVRACLRNVFSGYDTKSLRQWVELDLQSISRPKSVAKLKNNFADDHTHRILVILPANVFAAAWQAATAIWLAGRSVVLKPSRRETAFARILQESVLSINNSILPIEIDDQTNFYGSSKWTHKSMSYRAVIAYGRDQTLEQIRSLIPFHSPLVCFGSKVSIAYVSKSSLNKSNLQGITSRAAWDSVLYETQGCLSPQCFYLEKGGSISPEQFAEKLAHEMLQLDSKLPEKKTKEDCWTNESFWQHWRFRESQGRAHIFNHHVVFHQEPHFEPCGLKRVVYVVPLQNTSDLAIHCKKWSKKVSTIAVSDLSCIEKLKSVFGSHSGIRFCKIGQMHQPFPWWRNGGISLLQKLSTIMMNHENHLN